MARSHYKRRIKLIRPGLQTRLVLSFVGVAALAMMMQVMLVGALLTTLANQLPSIGDELVEHLPVLLTRVFLISAVGFLPLMFWVGVCKTFKVAGPVSKFESYLAQVRDGTVDEPCRIRETDELQELCTLINEALAASRARGSAGAEATPGVKKAS